MREIKLDQSKLHGFKILPKMASLQENAASHAGSTSKADTNPVVKLGAKVGGKPGVKNGAKIGSKIGTKNQ